MTERTYNIIMACKRNDKYSNVVDAAKEYMSLECDYPMNYYSEMQMCSIMFEAMCDYLDTCDKPSTFIRLMGNVFDKEYISFGEQIARAFQLVRVKKDDNYINGFGEWAGKEVTS